MKIVLVILTTFVFIFSVTVFETEARLIKKGTISIGGSSSFGLSDENYDKGRDQTSLYFNGQVGYFIYDQVEVGANFGLSYFNYSDSSIDNITRYSIGPFATYHIPLNDKSNIYIGGGLGYTQTKYDYDSGGDDDEDGISISASSGWEYFFTPTVACHLGLRVIYTDYDYSGQYVQNNDDTSIRIRTNAGIKVFF